MRHFLENGNIVGARQRGEGNMDHHILSEPSTFSELLHTLNLSIRLSKKKAAENIVSEMQIQRKTITDVNLIGKSVLLEIRYFILVGNFEEAAAMFEELDKDAKYQNNNENAYLYHYFKGQLFYETKQLQESILEYEKAAHFLELLSDATEKPDFYYKLANAYFHAYITPLSVTNATLAIQMAKEQKQSYVLAKSKLLQGLNYLEWKDYHSAEMFLQEALSYRPEKDGSEVNLSYMIHHNLGLVYLRQGLPETAINYFKRAIEDTASGHYMKSLYYLAESLFHAGKQEEALSYFDIGFSISKQEDDKLYMWIFAMLHKEFVEKTSFEGVWQQGIEYFKTIEDTFNVRYYSQRFAEYFFETGNHEKATYYYQLATK